MRFHVDTLQARVRDLEGVTTAREGYIKEKIARLLAREKDLWQRGRPMLLPQRERERGASFKLRSAYFVDTSTFLLVK